VTDSQPAPSGRPPLFSVVMVTHGRHELLDACLASLQVQVHPPGLELLVCLHDDAGAAEVVHRRFPAAEIVEIEHALPGMARNLLIERARGDILVFLDDDIELRPDFLAHLADQVHRFPEVAIFGGPNLTPPNSSRFQVVQGAVLASLVATGPVRRRYGDHPAQLANERYFTLCNLAVRRTEMPLFDPRLVCAEENAALAEMESRGLRMRYDPELVAFHERRDGYRSFCRQMFKYGRGRGQVLSDSSRRGFLPHLVPTALVAYLVTAPAGVVIVGPLWLVPLAAYVVAVLAGAAKVASSLHRAGSLPLAVALITSLHACYGTGVVAGLARGRRRDGVAAVAGGGYEVTGPASAT
jgi:GT2 family glycosyltransferase